MGLTQGSRKRARANYIKAIRGWVSMPTAAGRRFERMGGIPFRTDPRYHRESLSDPNGDAYGRYREMRPRTLRDQCPGSPTRPALYLLSD